MDPREAAAREMAARDAARKKGLRWRIPGFDILVMGAAVAALVGIFLTDNPKSKAGRDRSAPSGTLWGWVPGASSDPRLATPVSNEDWILDRDTWERAAELLPEPVLRRVKNGEYFFHVAPSATATLPSLTSLRFRQASTANHGRFAVDASSCALTDVSTGKSPSFYFGFPFPHVDSREEAAACKVAWNFEAANQVGNGGGASFFLTEMDSKGEVKRVSMSLQGQSYLGRAAGPIDNPNDLRNRWLSEVLDGSPIAGLAGVRERSNDPKQPDKAWRMDPKLRRVTRVAEATRSDPIAGLSIFGDDVNCFLGKIESHRWTLAGEGSVLAPVASTKPLKLVDVSATRSEVDPPSLQTIGESRAYQGAPWLIAEKLLLVPRPVWLLEATSTDPAYHFSKVLLYVDKELYRVWWKVVSNSAGEPFYNAMCVHYWAARDDGTFSVPALAAVVGVNDKTNRACIAGRPRRAYFASHDLTAVLGPR